MVRFVRFSICYVTSQVQLIIVIFTLNGFSCIFKRFKKKGNFSFDREMLLII